jgi:hypothetical protein
VAIEEMDHIVEERLARSARCSRLTPRARPDAGPEEVEEDAENSESRDGEDHTGEPHTGEPGQLSAAAHGQEHDDRVHAQGLTLSTVATVSRKRAGSWAPPPSGKVERLRERAHASETLVGSERTPRSPVRRRGAAART